MCKLALAEDALRNGVLHSQTAVPPLLLSLRSSPCTGFPTVTMAMASGVLSPVPVFMRAPASASPAALSPAVTSDSPVPVRPFLLWTMTMVSGLPVRTRMDLLAILPRTLLF